jgi:hypothetical protein
MRLTGNTSLVPTIGIVVAGTLKGDFEVVSAKAVWLYVESAVAPAMPAVANKFLLLKSI